MKTEKHLNPNYLSLAVFPIAAMFSETNTVLAKATAFFYKLDEKIYLITNWHNVTGINPLNNEVLSKHGGIPDIISMPLLKSLNPLRYESCTINLYEEGKAVWFVHPIHKEKGDVIAIEIEETETTKELIINPFNHQYFSDFKLEIADDLFILGYPLSLSGGLHFPIWKRGSVATEPDIDYDNLPKILVDTATRSGMSGAPVILKRQGVHKKNNKLDKNTVFGEINDFVGVYSGRILGETEFEAQLGIVWKKSVIDEIIRGQLKDKKEF